MRRIFLRPLAFAVALLLSMAGAAQVGADEPAVLDISGVELTERQATVGVSVRDADGVPVSGLSPADFAATVDGAAAQVTGVQAGENATLPIGIVIAIDTSGSMQGAYLAAAKAGATSLVDSLALGDEAALVTFDESVETLQSFTSDFAQLRTTVAALTAFGNTALYDAIGSAASLADGSSRPRHAVVFLADGEDFGGVSTRGREDALSAAFDAGVPFYVVGVGDAIDVEFLQELAAGSGGRYYDAATAADIGRLYGEISQSLRLHYTLTLVLPDGVSGKHTLAIEVGGAAAEAAFTTPVIGTSESPPVRLSLTGLPSTVAEEVTLYFEGAGDATGIAWYIDGEPFARDTTALALDPYALSPGPHSIRVEADGHVLESAFDVATLPPRILSPVDLPELNPGDVIRVTVESQAGSPAVSYLVNGSVSEVDESDPFEFVVPTGSTESSSTLAIIPADSHGNGQSLAAAIAPTTAAGSSDLAGRLLTYALLFGGFVVLGVGGFFWARSVRQSRPPKPDFEGLGPVLDCWQRESSAGEPVTEVVTTTSAPATWGTLKVLSGRLKGREFSLADDTELIGRGKFCSIRIDDGSLEPAHVLLNRDGTYRASTPETSIEVDGTEGLWGPLLNGSTLRVGNVALEFHHAS